MSGGNDRIWAGKISTLIILFLEILTVIYQLFALDFPIINSIVELIVDASTFLTVICLVFGVIAIVGTAKAYYLAVICVVDVILINRLYSNEKLKFILAWFQNLDKRILIFSVILLLFIAFVIYKIVSKKSEMLQQKATNSGGNGLVQSEDEKEVQLSSNYSREDGQEMDQVVEWLEGGADEERNTSDISHIQENKPADNKEFLKKINPIILAVCAITIFWGVFDYIIFNQIKLKISRPFGWIADYLHYGTIICAAILLGLFLVNLFLLWRNPISYALKKIFQNTSTFRLSGIAAIILEIVTIVLVNKIDAAYLTNTFLAAITENLFASIFALIILFLILQIACTIVFHLIGGQSDSKDFISLLKEKITEIEKKMALIACNIVKGCVDLFDFIPDFFATIGVLLLDIEDEKERTEQSHENEKS